MNIIFSEDNEDIELIKNTLKNRYDFIHYPLMDIIENVARCNPYIIFIDIDEIEMKIVEGIHGTFPTLNIIVISKSGKHALKAFNHQVSGYIKKPINEKKIEECINNLRYMGRNNGKLDVHTFGNFEVFYDGKPLLFKYKKSKEMRHISWIEEGPCVPLMKSNVPYGRMTILIMMNTIKKSVVPFLHH